MDSTATRTILLAAIMLNINPHMLQNFMLEKILCLSEKGSAEC